MNKPIGAIDCDDTAGEFTVRFLNNVNSEDGTDYSVEHIIDHDLSKGLGGSMSRDWYPRILEFAEVERESDPIVPKEGAVYAIGRLAVRYELVIITARPPEHRDIVEAFVETYLSDYVSDIITRDGEHSLFDKGEIIDHINAEFLLDDHFAHVDSAIKRGRKGILFGTLPKTLVHKDTYPHAANWYEAYEIITGEHINPALRRSESV